MSGLNPVGGLLTKDKLAKGLEVVIIGAVYPRPAWEPGTAAGEHASVPLTQRPRGCIESWTAGRFGDVQVVVANKTDRWSVPLIDLAIASEVIG